MIMMEEGLAACCRDEEDTYVRLPCDIHAWPAVKNALTELANSLILDPSPWLLVRKLSYIRKLLNCSNNKPDIKEKKSKDANSLQGGGVFRGLGLFLAKDASSEEYNEFFQSIFPVIVRHACALEERKPLGGLHIVPKQKNETIHISRSLAASIVACGFLCFFPGRSASKHSEFSPMNFDNFFCHLSQSSQCTKLRCILSYFRQVAEITSYDMRHITFTRKVQGIESQWFLEDWLNCDVPLCPITVREKGIIQDSGPHYLQVSFANRKIGGGVLGTGRVQEEIKFCQCPELMVAMLIFEAMDDNESILIEGHDCYSACHGYGRTLEYADPKHSYVQRDSKTQLPTTLCCIDALTRASKRQYLELMVLRELNKAFIGLKPVSTNHFEACSLTKPKCPKDEYKNFAESFSSLIMSQAMEELEKIYKMPTFPKRLDKRVRRSQSLMGARSKRKDFSQHGSAFNFLSVDRLGAHSQSSLSEDSVLSDISDHEDTSGQMVMAGSMDRSWSQRRRSSNMSDGSRRSSDAVSGRSSRSSSARWSSDFSSEFEEIYDSFQKRDRRHAAIEEESTQAQIQESAQADLMDFVTSLVADSMAEGSVAAAQMIPCVQEFDSVIDPVNVMRPQARRALVRPVSVSPQSNQDQDSNQTDDEKIQDNIVMFAGNLVGEILHSTPRHDQSSSSSCDSAFVLNALGITPEEVLSSRRSSRGRLPVEVDSVALSSSPIQNCYPQRIVVHDQDASLESPVISNVVNRIISGAISEVFPTTLRRNSSEDLNTGDGANALHFHRGESLTDDHKEALVSSGNKVLKCSPKTPPSSQYLNPRYVPSTSQNVSLAQSTHGFLSAASRQIPRHIEKFASQLSRSIMKDAKTDMHSVSSPRSKKKKVPTATLR